MGNDFSLRPVKPLIECAIYSIDRAVQSGLGTIFRFVVPCLTTPLKCSSIYTLIEIFYLLIIRHHKIQIINAFIS